MKKSKVMLGTLALSMALLGTGYAAWSDTIIVNTKVSTGELDVQFVEPYGTDGGVRAVVTGDGENEVGQEDHTTVGRQGSDTLVSDEVEKGGAKKAETATTAAGEDDVLTIDFSNLNPLATLTVTAPVENIGTVPVKLEDVIVKGVEDRGISLSVMYQGGTVQSGDVRDMADLTKDAIGDAVLPVDGTGVITYVFTVDGDNKTQNLTTGEATCKLEWVQAGSSQGGDEGDGKDDGDGDGEDGEQGGEYGQGGHRPGQGGHRPGGHC